MICYIANSKGKIIRTEEAEPVCGKDFCDLCGDCLVCYIDDICPIDDMGYHLWVKYEED